jgi:photosystem II stability/assembly factor-like uncharacterized protein
MRLSRILPALCLTLLALLSEPLSAGWTRIGPDGGDIAALAAAPSRPARLYAAVASGNVFRSLDRGRTWTRAGWTHSPRLSDLAVDPQSPTTVYAAGLHGVLKSTDGGASWSIVRRGNAWNWITGVTIHPRTGAIFAFGAQSLLRSTDRGRTWTTHRRWPRFVSAIAFDAEHPGVLFAGTLIQGVFRSPDGGETWQPASQGLPAETRVDVLASDPRSPGIFWAGVSNGRREGDLFQSTDGGATWMPSENGLGDRAVEDIVFDPESSSILYAIAAGQLFRSTNGGADWTATGSGLPPAAALRDLEMNPAGLLAASQGGVSLSTDRGLTWRDWHRGLTGLTISGLTFDEQGSLYAGTRHTGIFKTRDRRGSWSLLVRFDDPIAWTRLLKADPGEPETVYTNDRLSILRSTDGGRQWEPYGGLVCAVPTTLVVDPRNPGTVYASGSGCSGVCRIVRIDAVGERVCLASNLPDPDWGTILAVDPFTSAVYAHALGEIWKSTDRGATWSSLATILNLVYFAPSPVVEGTLYATQQGTVARSRDGGRTWQFFTAGLPERDWIQGMAFDPTDPDLIYAGTVTHGVFRSRDGGETWSPLGAWPRRWILRAGPVLDPDDPSIVYAGTEEASVLRYEP